MEMGQRQKQKPIVAIIGAGLMGTHAGEVLRKHFYPGFYDIAPERARSASEQTGGRFFQSPEELVRQAELTLFAVPMDVMDECIRKLAHLAKPGSAVTDVGSKKTIPMKAMAEAVPEGISYFGTHPNYRATISPHGQSIIVCRGIPEDGCKQEEMLADAWKRKGAKIVHMSAEEADSYSGVHQNLVHDSYYGVMGLLLELMREERIDTDKFFSTATPTSRRFLEGAGRLLGGNPHVYAGIQSDKNSGQIISDLMDSLEGLRALLAEEDAAGRKRNFEEHFLSLRAVLGEEFVENACAMTDATYEVPGGVEIFFSTDNGFVPADVEDLLKANGARSSMLHGRYVRDIGTETGQTIGENVMVTSLQSGVLGRIENKYRVAKTRLYKPKGSAEGDDYGATVFFHRGRDGKRIRFTPATLFDAEKLPEFLHGGEAAATELYNFIAGKVQESDKRYPGFETVRLTWKYDDPVLSFYATLGLPYYKHIRKMGPWLVSKS